MSNDSFAGLQVGLGVDVGGTFSDAVLLDLEQERVLSKAKSPTTHGDLSVGIRGALGRLERRLLPAIQLVSLSTTLATNALIEGRWSRVVGILSGYGAAHCPPEFADSLHLLSGGHTAAGEERAPLDLAGAGRIVAEVAGTVDAYAVSSYFSTRNPTHENALRCLIARLDPGVPVVCGHELSSQLNARVRATTTILNAHLIPRIRVLLQSVRSVLAGHGIQAPLLVVQGDGSLCREEVVVERPVATVLSGPAASVVGASHLVGRQLERAVVLDIGGTTADVAVLENGQPCLNEQGAAIGPWRTQVRAVDVRPVGLGGDSHIRVDLNGGIRVGPQRVEPLCLLAERFPKVIEQLRSVDWPMQRPGLTPTAFWTRDPRAAEAARSAREEDILAALSDGPRNLGEIAALLEAYPVTLADEVARLEARGAVCRAGFTPTDIFHLRGRYRRGRVEASALAAEVLSRQLGQEVEPFLLGVKEVFQRKASEKVAEVLGGHAAGAGAEAGDCPACRAAWASAFWERGEEQRRSQLGGLCWKVSVDQPLVGIGAPAAALVPPLAERLETDAYIPKHAEVASALGAIVGTILVRHEALVRPDPDGGFVCFTVDGRLRGDSVERAVERGREYLAERLRCDLHRSGGGLAELTLEEERRRVTLASGEELVVEVVLRGRGIAKPRLEPAPGAQERPPCAG